MPNLSISIVDRLQQLGITRRLIDRPGARERGTEDVQVGLGEQPYRDDPIVRHESLTRALRDKAQLAELKVACAKQ